ncbi:serine O-acetyltransferase [Hyphomonas sp.]|uniref:serine O-acetyltransferase n=1 Tax=Hyphomonas sp. TaxID=87 RepID=UPI00391BB478
MIASPPTNEPPLAALMGKDLIRTAGFWNVVTEDYHHHQRGIFQPGLQAVWVYRFGTWSDTIRFRPLGILMKALHAAGHVFIRNVYGIELRKTVQAGRRLRIGHQSGIVVHEYAKIGDDVTIRQNVTFGVGIDWVVGEGPVIGSRVSFSPGVVVIGNVTIGDDVSIGPNCVITQDVPSNRTLFVPPPRALPKAETVKDASAG